MLLNLTLSDRVWRHDSFLTLVVLNLHLKDKYTNIVAFIPSLTNLSFTFPSWLQQKGCRRSGSAGVPAHVASCWTIYAGSYNHLMDSLYALYLCFPMNIQPACVLFHMCSRQRCDIPRGRAESRSTRQRGSWSNTFLNTPSILVMELLCFLPHPPPTLYYHLHTYTIFKSSGHSFSEQLVINKGVFFVGSPHKKYNFTQIINKTGRRDWIRLKRRVSSVCNI